MDTHARCSCPLLVCGVTYAVLRRTPPVWDLATWQGTYFAKLADPQIPYVPGELFAWHLPQHVEGVLFL